MTTIGRTRRRTQHPTPTPAQAIAALTAGLASSDRLDADRDSPHGDELVVGVKARNLRVALEELARLTTAQQPATAQQLAPAPQTSPGATDAA